MANSRIMLTCKHCGKQIVIGKGYFGEYYTGNKNMSNDLNDFYLEHRMGICTREFDCSDDAKNHFLILEEGDTVEVSSRTKESFRAHEWISVEDRLPTENGEYWCAYTNPRGVYCLCIFNFRAKYNAGLDVNSDNVGKFTIFDGECLVPVHGSVTHWMPYKIPTLPRKEERGNE